MKFILKVEQKKEIEHIYNNMGAAILEKEIDASIKYALELIEKGDK